MVPASGTDSFATGAAGAAFVVGMIIANGAWVFKIIATI